MARVRSQTDLEERITAMEAKAAAACRDHDTATEWACECVLQGLYEQRADLPVQREAVE